MVSRTPKPLVGVKSEPAWAIARLFPDQGMWDETEFLFLTRNTNKLVELTDGHVEVLAMPTMTHQLLVAFLYQLLSAFAAQRDLGVVLFAPLRVRLRSGIIREPDIVFMRAIHAARMHDDAWDGADLVVEVVSDDPESRKRDLVIKREEYADAGIAEYWIIDPSEAKVIVLTLDNGVYRVLGEWSNGGGQTVRSVVLAGFEVGAEQIFSAAAFRGA